MSDGTIEYMFRGKGLTTNSILALAEEKFNGDLMTSAYKRRKLIHIKSVII